jgi:hypothetical protein
MWRPGWQDASATDQGTRSEQSQGGPVVCAIFIQLDVFCVANRDQKAQVPALRITASVKLECNEDRGYGHGRKT